MNKVILMGRLTKDPDVRYGGKDNTTAIALFSIAVDRKFKQADGERMTDFFNVVAYGKQAEVVEKYMKKGNRILVTGRIENSTYIRKDGNQVTSPQIIVEELDFVESKNSGHPATEQDQAPLPKDGFMDVPDGVEDEGLPFN